MSELCIAVFANPNLFGKFIYLRRLMMARMMPREWFFMGKEEIFSFLVDGELKSRKQTTATAFSRPLKDSLDMRRRPPGPWVGLAASSRSMPTAV